MATYRKTESEKWEAEVYLGKDESGKKIRKSKRFKLKRDAKNWANEMEIKKQNGLIINQKNYTIKKLFEEWLEEYASNKSPTTFDGYKMIVRSHINPALGDLKLEDINARHIKKYLKTKEKNGNKNNSQGLSTTTLRQHYHIFSSAFKYARKWDLMTNNPLRKIEPPKKSKYKAKALSKDQVDKLLNTAKKTNLWIYRFIYTAFSTGVRRGEILGLRWPDINIDENKIFIRNTIVKTQNNSALEKIPKSSEGIRPILISEKLTNIFKKMKKSQIEKGNYSDSNNKKYVFCMNDGRKVKPRTAYNRYNKIFKKANLNQFNLQSLRHTHATFLLQANVHPKIVQERLGHGTIEVTINIYSHVVPSLQQKAVQQFETFLNQ